MTHRDDVLVRLPTVLADVADGRREVRIAGSTVGDVVAGLVAAHPGCRDRVVDGSGCVQPWLNVFVGTTDVRTAQGMATPVDDRVVTIVPAVAGG